MEINFLQGNIFLTVLKIAFLIVDFILILFLIVVFRQFKYMDSIVKDLQDSPILKSTLIAIIVIAVSLFLTGLVIL